MTGVRSMQPSTRCSPPRCRPPAIPLSGLVLRRGKHLPQLGTNQPLRPTKIPLLPAPVENQLHSSSHERTDDDADKAEDRLSHEAKPRHAGLV
jgi:hypothetical protein